MAAGTARSLSRCAGLALALAACEAATATVPTTNAAIPADPSAAAPPAGANDDLLVTGLPSVVEYRARLSEGLNASAPVCLDFAVRDIDGGTARIIVAVAGVRGAQLMRSPSADAGCARSAGGTGMAITLNAPGDRESRFRLILPAAAFPTAASGATGELIMLRQQRPPARVPFTLRRADLSPFLQGALWFMGIAAPAIVTLIGGVILYRFQKRTDATNAQLAALDNFRRENESQLLAFFANLYANAMDVADTDLFTADMRRELGFKGILQALPRDRLDPLLSALSEGRRRDVARLLAEAFPEHSEAIMKPKKAQ